MGNKQSPSSAISLQHFHEQFPSLAYLITDDATFEEIFDYVRMTCEFLEARNMDCKDRVYTKRIKEMQARIREIIKRKTKFLVKRYSDLDMIINYISYACIYGCDVCDHTDYKKPKEIFENKQDVVMQSNGFDKLLKDIPEKTLKSHINIQEKLERQNPQILRDYQQVAEEESRRQGWDNLAQMEYFSNIERYEDLSFAPENAIGQNKSTLGKRKQPLHQDQNQYKPHQDVNKNPLGNQNLIDQILEGDDSCLVIEKGDKLIETINNQRTNRHFFLVDKEKQHIKMLNRAETLRQKKALKMIEKEIDKQEIIEIPMKYGKIKMSALGVKTNLEARLNQ